MTRLLRRLAYAVHDWRQRDVPVCGQRLRGMAAISAPPRPAITPRIVTERKLRTADDWTRKWGRTG